MNEDKKGIYKILNLLTGHFYIGSATMDFARRFRQHRSDLKLGKHRNIHLQRAYNRDGVSNFEFQIVEILDLSDKEILEREQWYLDQSPHYNIALIAGHSAKGRKATPEQRAHLSKSLKGRKAWNKGIEFSEESRAKMSKSMKGRVPINKGQSGLSYKPVERSDGQIFNNPTLAAQELGVKPNTIVSAIKRGNKCQGFSFKYIDNLK
jgi:group I intron endonuclease